MFSDWVQLAFGVILITFNGHVVNRMAFTFLKLLY